jgi:hypothetical protein
MGTEGAFYFGDYGQQLLAEMTDAELADMTLAARSTGGYALVFDSRGNEVRLKITAGTHDDRSTWAVPTGR